jgi:hypothetical protein
MRKRGWRKYSPKRVWREDDSQPQRGCVHARVALCHNPGGVNNLFDSCSLHWRSFTAAALLITGLLDAVQPALAAPEPIRLHPDNPHYFLWREKPTLLITAGEHYGAVLNLDFDHARYLDELKGHRFYLTRVFSGTYREVPGSFNITGNTLAPASGRFVCPWARSETPGASDGGNKFDLMKWDEVSCCDTRCRAAELSFQQSDRI